MHSLAPWHNQNGQRPRFATDETRSEAEPALRQAIEAWAGSLPVAQVVALLDGAGVPAAPSGTLPRPWNPRRPWHASCCARCTTSACPACACPPSPCALAARRPTQAERAPALGEHTDELLMALAGCGIGKLAELRAAGVFGTH